jgi:hypothetical protein
MYSLTLATEAETKQFQESPTQSGLPDELSYLKKNPLAVQSRGKPRGYDNIHLSAATSNPTLLQWYGRASSGYFYPIGPVMKLVRVDDSDDADGR